MLVSYFDDDTWFKMKWGFFGFAIGYVAKTFFGGKKERIENENTLFLVDPKEGGGIYNTLFGGNSDDNIYKQLYEKLNELPEGVDVNIVIRTFGGPAVWCLKICETIKNRKGLVRAYIKDYAYSAGSVIALAANELYMTRNASLSAIDPQISPLSVLSQIGLKSIPNLLHNDLAQTSKELKDGFSNQLEHYKSLFSEYLNERYNKEKVIKEMFVNATSHEHIYFARHLTGWFCGFNIHNWDGKTESLVKEKSSEIKTKII